MSSQLELNRGDNFIFGVDVSASMQTTDCPNGTSRIEYLKEQVKTFATEASKWDEDGIDVLTFGAKVTPYRNVTAEKAHDVIGGLKANEGMTDTAALIKAAYSLHKEGKYAQTLLFVATDGEPADRAAVKKVIIDISNDIRDEHEFAISFLTVGNIAPDLQNFLTALDDDLKGAKHDIVDVKKLEEVDFMAAFSGALHD
jgi:Mg-chelatase subunit ChlD